jgi:opacity protein-like surface antigen
MNNKMIIALAAYATLFTSIASAAPLTDYSEGKTSIDLTLRNADTSGDSALGKMTFDNKNNLDWQVTSGLGNNLAIQYRQFDTNSKARNNSTQNRLNTKEFNVLYKVNKNIAVYTGIMQIKDTYDIAPSTSLSSENSNRWQCGLIGTTKLANKLTGYAAIAAGENLENYELGVAYKIATHLDFNLSYRQINANKVALKGFNRPGADSNVDYTVKGLGCGISYTF